MLGSENVDQFRAVECSDLNRVRARRRAIETIDPCGMSLPSGQTSGDPGTRGEEVAQELVLRHRGRIGIGSGVEQRRAPPAFRTIA